MLEADQVHLRRITRAPTQARLQQWDGKAWKIISDYYTADEPMLAPMVKEQAAKYAKDKKITPRDCSKES